MTIVYPNCFRLLYQTGQVGLPVWSTSSHSSATPLRRLHFFQVKFAKLQAGKVFSHMFLFLARMHRTLSESASLFGVGARFFR